MSLSEIPQRPIFQALIAICLCIVGFVALKISAINATIDPNLYWVAGATSILLYTVINTSCGTRANDMKQYWFHSIYSFIVLFLFAFYTPKLLSGLSLSESKSFGKIYIVFVFCYLLFFSMTMVIKRFWTFLEAENDAKLRKDGLR